MCDFPSWLFTYDGRVLFLKDNDVEALVESGAIKSWADGVGNSAAEKVFGKGHRRREQINVPREVQNAIFNGEMNRLAKAAGYDIACVGGNPEVSGKRSFLIDCAVTVFNGMAFCSGCRVEAGAGSKVEAIDGSWVYAQAGSNVRAWGGSTVDAKNGSNVEAMDGSLVYAKAGSNVCAWDGSWVYAQAGSTVTAMAGSKVEAWDESTRTNI